VVIDVSTLNAKTSSLHKETMDEINNTIHKQEIRINILGMGSGQNNKTIIILSKKNRSVSRFS
jgi:hypothetical protein